MKKNKLGIVIAIAGITILLYPVVSNIIASHNQSVAISNYQEKVNSMTEEEIEEEKAKAREYNESLLDSNNIQISSFGSDSDSSTTESTEESEESEGVSYYNVLNIGEVMGYISIPAINVYLPIYHGTSENVLQSGVGHLESSSFPTGEKGTHAILAGHTGLVRTKIFDDIDKLVIGDKFYIYILGEELAYEVDQIKIVEPTNTEYTQIEEDKEYVTLLTCTPYAINTHRLLVRGVGIDETAETNEEAVETENTVSQDTETNVNDRIQKYIIILIIIIIAIILIIIFIIILKRIRKGKHTK